MNPDSQNNTYFSSIDGLRAVAVLLVVFYHFEFPLVAKGYLGVDIFFVISGFLISRKILVDTQNYNFNLKGFYLSRVRRLFPALFTTILFTLIGAALLFSPDALIRVSSSSIASLVSMANIRFWMVTGYFDVGVTMKPLLHFWSLSVEEQFYLVWPLLFLFFAKKIRFMTYVIAILGVTSFIFVIIFSKENPDAVFFLTPFRVYEFSLGAVLATIEFNRSKQFELVKSVALSYILLLLSMLMLGFALIEVNVYPKYVSNLLACLSAVCILIVRESGVTKTLLANQSCTFIGRLSYSLYLVHWPLWVFNVHVQAGDVSIIRKVVLIIITFLLAYLLHKFIENRFRYRATSKSLYTFLVLTFGLILLLSVDIRFSKGWSWRINQNPTTFVGESLECERSLEPILSQHCVFGETESNLKTSLLIGDSHSMSLLQGLNAFGKKHSVKFRSVSYPGCPPLIGDDDNLAKVNSHGSKCALIWNDVNSLISNQSFDSVFIAGRWLWLKDHQEYGAHKHSKSVALGDEIEGESRANAASIWQKEIQHTVNQFVNTIGKVVILSQVPLLQNNIGECDKLPVTFLKNKELRKRCSIKGGYNQIARDLRFTDQVVIGLKREAVLPVLPTELVCNSELQRCQIITDDGLLYVDESHLSQLGGLKLIQLYEAELTRFLFGMPVER